MYWCILMLFPKIINSCLSDIVTLNYKTMRTHSLESVSQIGTSIQNKILSYFGKHVHVQT